jgi:hypothetical protein
LSKRSECDGSVVGILLILDDGDTEEEKGGGTLTGSVHAFEDCTKRQIPIAVDRSNR